MLVLALNSGSSSLKSAVVDPATGETRIGALAENLGTESARITITKGTERQTTALSGADHAAALDWVLADLRRDSALWQGLCGVGHRVVHGGETFSESVLIDDATERVIETCATLAPLHNPANLIGIRAARRAFDHLDHVAVFDTAFHQTMPEKAFRYAVPDAWYRKHGVRRYGFHGTSHRYVAGEAASRLGKPLGAVNLITAHLGNGASATAISGGRSVDTTMGFTPLEGLVMGTRSGDIDPAIIFYLVRSAGMSLDSIEHALNRESGLLGMSGLSQDMRTLTQRMDDDDRAGLAVEVFCHRLAKALGALRTSFERLDAIVFTGGIGEHSALVRRMTLARLSGLGLLIDEAQNEKSSERIDRPESSARVFVIPTNEELMIARDTLNITQRRSAQKSRE